MEITLPFSYLACFQMIVAQFSEVRVVAHEKDQPSWPSSLLGQGSGMIFNVQENIGKCIAADDKARLLRVKGTRTEMGRGPSAVNWGK